MMKTMIMLMLLTFTVSSIADAKAKSPKAPLSKAYKVKGKLYKPLVSAKGFKAIGLASWYKHGKVTATGERYNPLGMTAAHKTLPLGTKLRVTNLDNNQKVIVKINDRGPFIKDRMIDLSQGVARKLKFSGTVKVKIESL